jgi:hypothetical protein
VKSYRAFKSPWVGKPKASPDIKVTGSWFHNSVKVFVSWNGATEVETWRFDVGERVVSLAGGELDVDAAYLKLIPKTAFKASFGLALGKGKKNRYKYVRVAALDTNGDILGRTAVVEIKTRRVVSSVSVL